MAQIPPITDAYIDDIVKAPDAYNPTLNKTQGVKLRELLKLMRDRLEQQTIGSATGSGFITVTYQELTSLMSSGTLIPGRQYLLSDYKTTWRISDNSIRKADAFEPLILLALTAFKISTEALSTIYPQDKIFYSIGTVDYDGNISRYDVQAWSSTNGLIPETGFIYRRIDSLSNRDINFDFRGFWYGSQSSHYNLYFSNNVKIISGGLDAEYNRQPLILGYSNVSNSTVSFGAERYTSVSSGYRIPETADDLKLSVTNSFVDVARVSSTISDHVTFLNSTVKGIYLKNSMPSFTNVDNANLNGNDISVYESAAFELLSNDFVKSNVTIYSDLKLQIAQAGLEPVGGVFGLNIYNYYPLLSEL